MTVPLHAALDLRVSTARQAEHDVSIPDPAQARRSPLPITQEMGDDPMHIMMRQIPVAPLAPAPTPLTIRPGVPDGLRQRFGLQ